MSSFTPPSLSPRGFTGVSLPDSPGFSLFLTVKRASNLTETPVNPLWCGQYPGYPGITRNNQEYGVLGGFLCLIGVYKKFWEVGGRYIPGWEEGGRVYTRVGMVGIPCICLPTIPSWVHPVHTPAVRQHGLLTNSETGVRGRKPWAQEENNSWVEGLLAHKFTKSVKSVILFCAQFFRLSR